MLIENSESGGRWRELLAVGVVAGDLSPDTIARCAGVSRLEVIEALTWARAFGALDDDGHIHPDEAVRLVADLPIDVASRVHAELARHLFAEGRESLDTALTHVRKVTADDHTTRAVEMCDQTGEISLSLGDYTAARRLFETADEIDLAGEDRRRGRRLLAMADAMDGEGDVMGGRRLLERAAVLAERCGDVELMVEATVRHTLPTDWYAGDHHSLVMLQRAERMDLSPEQSVRVTAARSLAEARIPVLPHEGQQLAWITRPEVARPLAEQALAESVGMSPESRAMALLAWRSNHRSPQYLARRREVTAELLAVAEQLRRPALQVDAAVFMAVDALESGDRGGFDKALGMARWVADRDGNPRLAWRVNTLAAGSAHLDGKVSEADTLAATGEEIGQSINTPGWFAAKMFFWAQSAISSDDPDQMRPLMLDEAHVGMTNPLALSGVAYCFARNGDSATAERYARTALRHLDFESSPLLLLTRVAAVALIIDEIELRHEVLELLTPWAEHVSVDANGWWCDGPVSLWMGMLHASLGDTVAAGTLLDAARPMVRALNDVRSHRRMRALMAMLPTATSPTNPHGLTDREVEVLRLVAAGLTNQAIADRLAFSVSTVRNDTTSIYRTLNVTGRTDAVAKAIALGLVDAPSPASHRS